MRIISAIFLIISLGASSAFGAIKQEEQELKAYVEGVVQQGYDIVNDKSFSPEQKREKSATAIKNYLHLDWMARHALGRHRKTLTEAKMKEFIAVYSSFVVKAYADIASNYKGEKAIIKNIKKIDDNLYMVSSEFLKPGSQSPIKVEYLVHKMEGNKQHPYLVGDIIAEGISTLNSQQGEFNSVISSHGVDWLINDLKNRIASNVNLAPKK